MPILAGYALPHPPVIVPEVGAGREADIQATIDGFHAVARHIAALQPHTIILISPHVPMYADYIHISPGDRAQGSLQQFGALAKTHVMYDAALVDCLCRLCSEADFPAGTLGEKQATLDHGTLVPLHFINQHFSDYQLVRCSLSGLSRQQHYEFGMLLQQAVTELGRDAIIVASGDLSHKLTSDGPYGYHSSGPKFDAAVVEILREARWEQLFALDDELCEQAAECGLLSLITMAGALDGQRVNARLHSYEGPFGVGYAVASFEVTGQDDKRCFLRQERQRAQERIQAIREREDAHVRLARVTLESFIRSGQLPALPDLSTMPVELLQRAGTFVSIKKQGQLRGCIGTIAPTTPHIAMEIQQNAISAGTQDHRFSPVQPDELYELIYSVDVLSPAEACERADLDPQRYGVIVTCGRKRGLLLPRLEGIDTVERQIEIASNKADIRSHESYTLQRFEVVRHT